jgi:soluble lytic murein transglycosylase
MSLSHTVKFLFTVLLLALLWSQNSSAATGQARDALDFADKQRWDEALYHARNAEPTLRKLVSWMLYRTQNSGASFEDITQFIKKNPDWPDIPLLQQRAEEALSINTPKSTILAWFSSFPPVTPDGMKFYAEAKASQDTLSAKEQEEITSLFRQAWAKANFGNKDESDFLADHRDILRPADYQARIDNLLWQGKIKQAKELFWTVDKPHRTLYETRIHLMENKKNASVMLHMVPRALQRDPGLLYEQIAWHERKGNTGKVRELLRAAPNNPPYPAKWWDIKNNHIRLLLKERQYKTAYALSYKHGNNKGEDFAEAEWLSGWIALRFLGDARSAYKHFYALYQGTQYPVSKARGAYWAGRASEKNSNHDIATKWYRVASQYPDSYYGQLSLLKLDKKRALNLPPSPAPTVQDKEQYKRNELIQAASLLLDSKQPDLARKMVLRAVVTAKTPGEVALITEFGQSMRFYDLSVEAGKQAARRGTIVTRTSYPTLKTLPNSSLENSFPLAIIRQESSFDSNAQSPAGALGLMQLMPATAAMLAKELDVRYDRSQLATPSYNMKLGTHYLQKLINTFDGSYILAIAAYNGGQGNVRKWIRDYGDPRQARSLEEVIDWIELIPFSETRNYTQRVLENLQIYREILSRQHASTKPLLLIEKDLKR